MATDRGDVCSKFLDVVPHALYPFQEQAILEWFSSEGGLLVSAPTGMGKTLIAEAALFEALVTRRTAYYTTPLIALTDQKFRELQDKVEAWGFHADDVGLLTGNRRINPDAPIKVVVAEILLNHLLSHEVDFTHVDSVVMDEFHWFNDRERGFVWELALTFLPEHVKALLLSATIGNVVDVVSWSRVRHGRKLGFVTTDERRVPLETTWVEDRLLPELLVELASGDDSKRSTPALVFCFARDECWETAEILKGKNLLQDGGRARIEAALDELDADMTQGAGPKLKQMLIRGVGVHHAGILPRHKEVVEALFLQKLVPVVVCTETLAAGINLPARSVVLTTLMKGPPQQKKLIAPSDAHQMFGRAGRPQFDTKGNVFALAHEDDVKIFKWKLKWDALNHASKDPGILSAKKDLERKKPSRRANQQYWTKGQFDSLLRAKPSNLESREMIPYRVLIHLLVHGADVKTVRDFLAKRLCGPERVLFFERRLDAMIDNLVALGYVTRDDAGTLAVTEAVDALAAFRSIDPLYGRFLAQQLVYADRDEKLAALESVLDAPPQVVRAGGLARAAQRPTAAKRARTDDDRVRHPPGVPDAGGARAELVRAQGQGRRRERRSAVAPPAVVRRDAEDRVRAEPAAPRRRHGEADVGGRGRVRVRRRLLPLHQVAFAGEERGARAAAPAAPRPARARVRGTDVRSGLRRHRDSSANRVRVGGPDLYGQVPRDGQPRARAAALIPPVPGAWGPAARCRTRPESGLRAAYPEPFRNDAAAVRTPLAVPATSPWIRSCDTLRRSQRHLHGLKAPRSIANLFGSFPLPNCPRRGRSRP
jgi:superfamily II DNA/RNA helicase